MCFSSTASFASGIVLLGVGAVTISKAQAPGQRLLSFVPVFFALQQLIEGTLWLALEQPVHQQWQQPATYSFLIFAQVLWPVMVPLTVLSLETEQKIRVALSYILGLGIGVAVYLSICLAIFPATAEISGHHIKYNLDFPFSNTPVSAVFYLLPTILPPFLSSNKQLRWLGLVLLVSFLVTIFFYREYLVSVWCYFAAIISAISLYIIVQMNKGSAEQKLLLQK